jgi:hypothetical protein
VPGPIAPTPGGPTPFGVTDPAAFLAKLIASVRAAELSGGTSPPQPRPAPEFVGAWIPNEREAVMNGNGSH